MNFKDFIANLPKIEDSENYGVYPKSINEINGSWVFMIREANEDFLVVTGSKSNMFEGETFTCGSISYIKASLIQSNGQALRKLFPFTSPIPVLRKERSVGLGDRLGIATPGHIRVFEEYDAYPIFAQQSIRELKLTNRSFEAVLDSASFAVYREGYKDGFGADGDHLKKPEDIEYALSVGYTMITLDCSDHIRYDVNEMSTQLVDTSCTLSKKLKERYLNRTFEVEGTTLIFQEEELKRCVLIYGDAIAFATKMFETYFANGLDNADFEISIDETETLTSPLQHYFVANELVENNVKFATLAPRFCGEFQKGVDYIGNLEQFEKEFKIHAAIARVFGYKLSIHSGSDKFSTFSIIGKHTLGKFHLKTAGTNWLEAMRVVAIVNPKFYRQIHKFALTMFDEAKKFYHVTTDLKKIADVNTLNNNELVDLFSQNDARQLIHITYGFILNKKDEHGNFVFRDKLFSIWRENEEVYSQMLYKHIGKHLELLYSGFEK